jgi:microcystin-dependent protein
MSGPYIGEIKMVAFDFPPKGWAHCDGKMLNAQQHSDLFSLLGNAFGGDQTNFALPDMRSRFPIGAGQGDDLTDHIRGEKGGVETAPLHTDNLPAHSHALKAYDGAANNLSPNGNVPAREPTNRMMVYSTNSANTNMGSSAIANTGAGHSHENMPPFLAIYFIIAIVGTFPSRN